MQLLKSAKVAARTSTPLENELAPQSVLRDLTIGILRIYKRWISPMIPSACRFHPTCSEYMIEAVERHGAIRGLWLGVRRLLRCHPFHQGGFDPVR
jgi:putative membrane protein insertion efficiency factor